MKILMFIQINNCSYIHHVTSHAPNPSVTNINTSPPILTFPPDIHRVHGRPHTLDRRRPSPESTSSFPHTTDTHQFHPQTAIRLLRTIYPKPNSSNNRIHGPAPLPPSPTRSNIRPHPHPPHTKRHTPRIPPTHINSLPPPPICAGTSRRNQTRGRGLRRRSSLDRKWAVGPKT